MEAHVNVVFPNQWPRGSLHVYRQVLTRYRYCSAPVTPGSWTLWLAAGSWTLWLVTVALFVDPMADAGLMDPMADYGSWTLWLVADAGLVGPMAGDSLGTWALWLSPGLWTLWLVTH